MDEKRLFELLEKLNERSDRWIKDAEDRKDLYDIYFYQGQKKIVEEIKNTVMTWLV